jgi:hypothetical protein
MTAPPTLQRDDRPAAPQVQPRLGISVIQVMAAALAAITATIVASFFGVAGTVIGAGISSVLSVVGTAVYGHSLRKTRERMRVVVPAGTRRTARPVPAALAAARPPRSTYTPPPPSRDTANGYGPVRYSSRRRPRRTRLMLASAALFVAVLAVVTAVEAIAQRPISDLVRGNHTVSGTTLFGNRQQAPGPTQRPSSAATRPTPTVTRTVTRTAPPSTQSVRSSSSVPSSSRPSPSPTSPSPTSTVPSSATASPSPGDQSAASSPLG